MLESSPLLRKRPVLSAEVREWCAGTGAASLMEAESLWLQARLARYFGSYLLRYNALDDAPLVTDVRHQVRLGCDSQPQELYVDESGWAVQPEAADVVILQHSLEFARSPYDLLREAARAVRPGGHLLLLVRNPWGLCASRGGPWPQAHRLAASRVAEWLAVLGFALDAPVFAHYLPARWQAGQHRLEAFLVKRQWPLGACYMIAARKQVHAAPLQRQRSRRIKDLLPLPVAPQRKSPEPVKEQRIHD